MNSANFLDLDGLEHYHDKLKSIYSKLITKSDFDKRIKFIDIPFEDLTLSYEEDYKVIFVYGKEWKVPIFTLNGSGTYQHTGWSGVIGRSVIHLGKNALIDQSVSTFEELVLETEYTTFEELLEQLIIYPTVFRLYEYNDEEVVSGIYNTMEYIVDMNSLSLCLLLNNYGLNNNQILKIELQYNSSDLLIYNNIYISEYITENLIEDFVTNDQLQELLEDKVTLVDGKIQEEILPYTLKEYVINFGTDKESLLDSFIDKNIIIRKISPMNVLLVSFLGNTYTFDSPVTIDDESVIQDVNLFVEKGKYILWEITRQAEGLAAITVQYE